MQTFSYRELLARIESLKSHRSIRLRSRQASSRGLSIESLESRNLLAGWVANGVIVSGSDPGMGIAVDAAGNSYVTGNFSGTVNYGNTTLTSNGLSDAFVAKVTPNGAFEWAIAMGAASYDSGNAIAVDVSGDVYVTGQFYGQVAFGSITVNSQAPREAFVAKISPNGQFQWVARGGGSTALGFAIDTDTSGRVFVAGRFNGSGNFAGLPMSSTSGDPDDSDAFAAALNASTGAPLWVKTRGGPWLDSANSVAVDSQNNVFLTWSEGADPLLADRGQAMLSKLNPTTGDVIWNYSLGSVDLEPRVRAAYNSLRPMAPA
jgi:hypothetical protein